MLKGLSIVLLTILFFINGGVAQTTVEFETGFVNSSSGLIMYNHSDTHVAIRNLKSTTGSNFVGADLLLVNKQTLIIDDTIFSWDIANSDFKRGLIDFYKDSSGNNYYVELGETVNDKELILNYYSLTDDYKIDSLLITKRWANKYFQRVGFAHDELIIVYTGGPYPYIDSLYIETYNTSGVMLQNRLYDAFDSSSNQVYIAGYEFLEIQPYPLAKAFVLSNMVGTKIFVVDQNTLDTVITYDAERYGQFPANSNLINGYGYFEMVNRKVRVENDGIVLTGTVLTKPYYFNGDIWTDDNQFFRMKQYWDRTYDIQDFGPIDINNGGCFGYDVNDSTQTHVIAGSIPWDNNSFVAQEKREILIYIYDQWGKYDSIFLHGNKNHFCKDLFVEDNGDIFIAGTYTNAWSTDSVYNWLTKIPGIAVGMIEQEKINNHLYLFPNPTVELIQIKEVSKFLNGEFEIYSQTGVLVKQGEVTGQEIDVSSFIAGVYVLTVKSESGEQFNAIFVKE